MNVFVLILIGSILFSKDSESLKDQQKIIFNEQEKNINIKKKLFIKKR